MSFKLWPGWESLRSSFLSDKMKTKGYIKFNTKSSSGQAGSIPDQVKSCNGKIRKGK